MKKYIYSAIVVIAIVFLVIFRKEIMQELGQFEFVQDLSSKIMGVEQADTDVSDVGNGYYAYRTLNEEEQLVYNQMADCLFNHKGEVTISTKDENVADGAFQCLLSDHPEIFWTSAYELTTYNLSGLDSDFVFKPVCTMKKDEIENYQKMIEEAVTQCINGVPEGADEYSTAKYLFEYIILNTDYNKNAENNQNMCSVFVDKESVCMGYSKAYQYLLQRCGIESVIVAGESENEAHAWNLVKLDNEYYYVDVTWGDPEFSAVEGKEYGYIDYSFFGMNTLELLKTHTIDNGFDVPECISTSCNYYQREGLYLESFDKKLVSEMINRHLEGNSFVSIRCKDEEVYDELYRYLIKQSNVCDFIQSDTVSYIENDIYHTLNIFKPL